MKKIFAILLSCMLVLTALTACTAPVEEEIIIDDTNEAVEPQIEGEEAQLPANEENEENEDEVAEDEALDGTAETESFASVAEFLNAFPTIGDTLKEAFGGEMDIDLEARDNMLAYVFSTDIFDELAQQDPEGIESIYAEVFGNLAPALGQSLAGMKASIPSLEGLVIELRDSKGNVVYNDAITAEDIVAEEGADVNYEEFTDGISVGEYAELLSQQEVYSDETFVVTIEARGNDLVYIYTLKEQIDVTEEFLAALDESYSDAEETLSPVYIGLKSAMPDLENVIYEYVNADGEVFAAYQYAE